MRPNLIVLTPLLSAACWSPAFQKESADAQVYDLLERAAAKVLDQRKVLPLERPVDTLRRRLLDGHEAVQLSLLQALDVAAENSREFQQQKEQLYLVALNLTRSTHDFELQFGGGGSAAVSGTADDETNVRLSDDLSAAVTSTAGTRVVASFVNTFLRSVLHGGNFDGSSILNLTLTQPLLRGAGRRIVREPLTQAERDVIYQVRAFERFRSQLAVNVVSSYYDIVRQIADLQNVEAHYATFVKARTQIAELQVAGRKTITDLGRAEQSEYTANAQQVTARNRLQTALDRFKLTLGVPTTAQLGLDARELERLQQAGATPVALTEADAIAVALQRRFDHRTAVDNVEDAGRRILVAEDALSMSLGFTAALNVPAESGKGLNLDWSKVNWSAGFDLDLALDKLTERNAYRAALISFDVAVRARELSDDQIAVDVRTDLRNIQSDFESYNIQTNAVRLARQRVEATTALYDANRVTVLETVDAQNALLQAQLDRTRAIVDYSVARLQLLRDLEAIALEPKGLRFDPALPIPQPQTAEQHP